MKPLGVIMIMGGVAAIYFAIWHPTVTPAPAVKSNSTGALT